MSDLSKKKCIPCSGDIPPFTEEQIKNFMIINIYEVSQLYQNHHCLMHHLSNLVKK